MPATKMNEGLNQLDQGLLNKLASGAIQLHLNITSGLTPAVTDTFASNPNHEPMNSGYPAGGVTLTGTSWTGSATAGTATYTFPAITFTFTANAYAETVYGYYLTLTVGGTTYLLAEQNFANSYLIPAVGGQLLVNLTETLS
jgi:hypothetical protein